jgi:hypothetical protein
MYFQSECNHDDDDDDDDDMDVDIYDELFNTYVKSHCKISV